jgi:hypothetical protein
MPRFYFHLYNDVITCDEEGREIADVDTARSIAVAEARALLAAEAVKGHIDFTHRVVIADEGGRVVATVTYRDAVAVQG